MCGIAGILYKDATASDREIGQALITMLDGCQHRGPDSTGFALYHETERRAAPAAALLRRRGRARPTSTVDRIEAKLAEFEAAIVEEERRRHRPRASPSRFDGDLQAFSYAMEHVAKVVSIGESLDIIKDVGGAHDVDDTYDVAALHGHARHRPRAPRDRVRRHAGGRRTRSGPPGFADVAIVHNGQITNYWKMRRRLEKRGFEFNTDNDSELIAVYLADKLDQGSPLADALETSIQRPRRHVLVPRLDEGRDRLREGPPGREAHGHVRGRRARRHRLGGGLAQQALPGQGARDHRSPPPGTFRTWRRSI